MANENPFTKMIDFMRSEGATFNPPSLSLGKIISVKPFVLQVGELQLDKDNILISDFLIADYKREFKTNTMQVGAEAMSTQGYTPHTHDITSLEITKGEISFSDILKPEDVVAVLPTSDGQTFIVLCKVVRLT